MVICQPSSVKPHKHFKAEVYVLSKDEGGRHKPFFNGYRPQFYFRTTDVTGDIKLPDGVEMVMPGDNVSLEVKLINTIAMEIEVSKTFDLGSNPSARAKNCFMDKISLYVKESYHELVNKVTWPTWNSLLQSTVLVLVASLIISLVIFVMDLIAKNGLDFIYPGGNF